MLIADREDGMGTFVAIFMAAVFPLLLLGGWLGISASGLLMIFILWTIIAAASHFIAILFEDYFAQIWPFLVGMMWVVVWPAIHMLAIQKSGYPFEEEFGLPPFIVLPWWDSLWFKLIILLVLIGACFGINYLRSNR